MGGATRYQTGCMEYGRRSLYKFSYIVSLEMTLNERIGVLLWHKFKVFVLRFPKGGVGGGCFSPLSTPPKSATDLIGCSLIKNSKNTCIIETITI